MRFLSHSDAPQSVGLLWTSDQLVAETSTWQHKTQQTDIHALSGIRTYNLSRRAAVDLRLRPRDHWGPAPQILWLQIWVLKCTFIFGCTGLWHSAPAASQYSTPNSFARWRMGIWFVRGWIILHCCLGLVHFWAGVLLSQYYVNMVSNGVCVCFPRRNSPLLGQAHPPF